MADYLWILIVLVAVALIWAIANVRDRKALRRKERDTKIMDDIDRDKDQEEGS